MINESIYEILPTFETLEERHLLATRKIKILDSQDDDSCIDLAATLDECEEGYRCLSGACPICTSIMRANLILSALKLTKIHTRWCMATIVLFDSKMDDKDMLLLNITRHKNRLYNQLKRSGFNLPAIGSFENVYIEGSREWLPHFHFITPYIEDEIHKLKGVYPGNRSTKVSKIRDIAYQTSYAMKFIWLRKYKHTKNGKLTTKNVYLRTKQEIIASLTQDEIGIFGQLFLYGVKRYGNELHLSVNGTKWMNRYSARLTPFTSRS